MFNRRIVGFVEGFIATTGVDRYGRSFSLPQINELRDEIDAKPWLFLGLEPNEPPAGRVTRSEIRDLGTFQGLWARVEFYQANALKITSEGILNFFGFTTPTNPMERRRPEDFAAYDALREQRDREMEEELIGYRTPPVRPLPPPPAPPPFDEDLRLPPRFVPEPRRVERWPEEPDPFAPIPAWDAPAAPQPTPMRQPAPAAAAQPQPVPQPPRRRKAGEPAPLAADAPGQGQRQLSMDL